MNERKKGSGFFFIDAYVPVVVDEAYYEFSGETMMPFTSKYNNLIVLRSFSKWAGLAGLRVGYALGSAELIEGLERVKNSFNSYPMDRLALAGALKCPKARTAYSRSSPKRGCIN